MPHTVARRVQEWSRVANAPDFNAIHEQIDYHARRRFGGYAPTVGPERDFAIRLRDWLDGVHNEEDQKVLFQLVSQIFYVAADDFSALYRAALRGPIVKWALDELAIRFDDAAMQGKGI